MIDAISVGGLYALTALGIGLIFSVMRLANFAHAEFVTAAAYTLFALSGQSVIMAYRRFGAGRDRARACSPSASRSGRCVAPISATLLISSFAVSMFLQKLLIFAVGSRPKALDPLPMLSQPIIIGNVQVSALKLVTIAVCVVLLGGAHAVPEEDAVRAGNARGGREFHHGPAARRARQCGDRHRLRTQRRAGCGVAVLFAAQTGFVQPRLGVQLVIIAFVATVIGGLGNLFGAAVGGFFVGAVATLLQAFLPPELRAFREAFLFIVVILVLLVRPQGLFPARGLRERV